MKADPNLKIKLEKLKKHLPANYWVKVMEMTGCSKTTVFNVMRGESCNVKVTKAIIKMAKKKPIEPEINGLHKKISELVNDGTNAWS